MSTEEPPPKTIAWRPILSRLWTSGNKVFTVLFFMFLPLILLLSIVIIWNIDNPWDTVRQKLVPGEILAYCLSLLAQMFIMYQNTHGEGFKLPWGNPIFKFTLAIYSFALILVVLIKGAFGSIEYTSSHTNFFLALSFLFLCIAILIRWYADYQESRFKDYGSEKSKDEKSFNQGFNDRLNA